MSFTSRASSAIMGSPPSEWCDLEAPSPRLDNAARGVPHPEPERYTVIRYRCPFCHRSRSSKRATSEHINRCWRNPEVRSCKTCTHYVPAYGPEPDTGYGHDEDCTAGIDLGDRARRLPINCPMWEQGTGRWTR